MKMEINEQEKDEAVASRAQTKTKIAAGTRASVGGAVSASGVVQEMKVCSTQFLLHSENSLTKPEATILALSIP